MKVIILLVDSLRADHMGCYGYSKNTSPHIDDIARRNMLFENAISQSNWTYPSIYAMISGRYPSVLQIKWFDQRINSSFKVLPEFMEEQGFHTAIFSSFKILLNPSGFSGHFKERQEVRLNDSTPAIFLNWLKQHKDSFLFFHIGDYVHGPHCVDKKYVNQFIEKDNRIEDDKLSDALRALTTIDHDIRVRDVVRKINMKRTVLTDRELRYLLACYDGGVFYTDMIIGEMHKILKENCDEYLFIVTADHGEAFMEHNIYGHGYHLYDELIRVPLVIDYSGKYQQRISETVQHMDFFPTIADVLGFKVNFAMNGTSFAEGFERGHIQPRYAISEGYPFISIRNHEYKLLYTYSKFWSVNKLLSRFGKESGKRTKTWKRNLHSILLRYTPDRF